MYAIAIGGMFGGTLYYCGRNDEKHTYKIEDAAQFRTMEEATAKSKQLRGTSDAEYFVVTVGVDTPAPKPAKLEVNSSIRSHETIPDDIKDELIYSSLEAYGDNAGTLSQSERIVKIATTFGILSIPLDNIKYEPSEHQIHGKKVIDKENNIGWIVGKSVGDGNDPNQYLIQYPDTSKWLCFEDFLVLK